MKNYRCPSCGKLYNPVKNDLCPGCGAAPAPGILSTIERERSILEHRREEQRNSDPHCHDDDAWTGSYGAQVHSSAEHFATGSSAPRQTQSAAQTPQRAEQSKQKPRMPMTLVIFIIFFFFFVFSIIISALSAVFPVLAP